MKYARHMIMWYISSSRCDSLIICSVKSTFKIGEKYK